METLSNYHEKNKKIDRDEPKNANHGQAEQSRVEGQRGKGIKFPTREHQRHQVTHSKKKAA